MPSARYISTDGQSATYSSNISDDQLSYLLDWVFVAGPVDATSNFSHSDCTLTQRTNTWNSLGTTGGTNTLINNGNSESGQLDALTSYWTESNNTQGLIITSDITFVENYPFVLFQSAADLEDNNGTYKYTLLFSKEYSGTGSVTVEMGKGTSGTTDSFGVEFADEVGLYQYEIPASYFTSKYGNGSEDPDLIKIVFLSPTDSNTDNGGIGIGMAGIFKSFGSITANALPCFMKDTEILTSTGTTKIQDINNGDIIINKDGLEKTVLFSGSIITYNKTKYTEPYLVKKDTFSKNVPNKDTYVSPLHKMYTEKHGLMEVMKLADHYDGIVKADTLKVPYIYYTLVLDNHDSYFANNIPVESMPKENQKLYNFVSKNKLELLNADKDLLEDN